MLDEEKKQLAEIRQAMIEFDKMSRVWHDRDADPLIVCSIGITRFIALAGSVFANEKDFRLFVDKCIAHGLLLHEMEKEDDNGNPEYIH